MGLLGRLLGRTETRALSGYGPAFGIAPTASGAYVSPRAAEKMSAVLACVNAISSNIATLPAYVYQRNNVARTEAPQHPVARLVRQPNEHQTWPDFIEWLLASTLLTGNGLAAIEFDGAGRPSSLTPLPWGTVAIQQLPSGRLAYDVVTGRGMPRRYLDGEILHLRDRSDDALTGRSRLSRAAEVIGTAAALQEWSGSMWRNQGTPSGALSFDAALSPTQFEQIRSRMASQVAGPRNARAIMVLEGGAKWQNLSVSPEDAEMLGSRRFSTEEICRLFQGSAADSLCPSVPRPSRHRATLLSAPWLSEGVTAREFMAAYEAATAGTALPIGASRVQPKSISALAVAYYGSTEFQQLAPVTRQTYRNVIERFRAEHGDKPVALPQREHIRRMVAARADRPAAANALLKMLRILMRFVVEDGWRKDDLTYGVRRVKIRSEGHATWSEEDIAMFEARWPSGTRQRLALALLLYTGQRKGDVVRMGRQHLRSGAIDVRQQKTGTRLTIPVHPALQTELAALPPDQLTFLTTQPGPPFTAAGFGNWFADSVKEAGVPAGRTAHGLRKAAARRLAGAGCSAHEIMAIGGWRTMKEVERYTRAVDQERLARSAMRSIRGGT